MKFTINIGWPDKLVWPNGRTKSHQAKARAMRNARNLANLLTREALGVLRPSIEDLGGEPITVTVACIYANESHRPDRDNVAGACKPFLDGMADRLGINDRNFGEPVVLFHKVPRCKPTLTVTLGAAA